MAYNSPRSSPYDNFRSLVFRGGTPVTNALLIANVFTFVTFFFLRETLGRVWAEHLVMDSQSVWQRPWTLVTYPLLTPDPIMLLFWGFTLWQFGGSLERSWGTQVYGRAFLALTMINALSLLFGSFLLRSIVHDPSRFPVVLMGFMLPLAGLIVAFCMLRPEETINLFFFPVKAKYVALIAVVLCWYFFGRELGFFACGGCLAAWLYVRSRAGYSRFGGFSTRKPARGPDLRVIDFDKPRRPNVYIDGSPPPPKSFDIFRIWRERQERKRLEKLWNESRIPPRHDWPDEDRR